MNEADLIRRVGQTQDRAAFGELVRGHQSAVRNFLRHLTRGDHSQADDLAQETFLQAWRSIGRYEGRASFSTWLLGIAHNQWRNARRRRQPVSLQPEHLAGLEPTPAAAPLSDLRDDLAQAMQSLSEAEQLAIHLGFHQGLSHPEIAEVTQWPLGTAKTHLARAKEKLRQQLTLWNPRT